MAVLRVCIISNSGILKMPSRKTDMSEYFIKRQHRDLQKPAKQDSSCTLSSSEKASQFPRFSV